MQTLDEKHTFGLCTDISDHLQEDDTRIKQNNMI